MNTNKFEYKTYGKSIAFSVGEITPREHTQLKQLMADIEKYNRRVIEEISLPLFSGN